MQQTLISLYAHDLIPLEEQGRERKEEEKSLEMF